MGRIGTCAKCGMVVAWAGDGRCPSCGWSRDVPVPEDDAVAARASAAAVAKQREAAYQRGEDVGKRGQFSGDGRRVGRWLLRAYLTALAFALAIIALIATPLMLTNSKESARAEVPAGVESIRDFELAHKDQFGEYVAADPAPRAPKNVGSTPVPWTSNPSFDRLAWAPEDPDAVYGSYAVVLTGDGFIVTGTCDVDGDGERATYTATENMSATASTDAAIY